VLKRKDGTDKKLLDHQLSKTFENEKRTSQSDQITPERGNVGKKKSKTVSKGTRQQGQDRKEGRKESRVLKKKGEEKQQGGWPL